jgi:hypothetical protein
VAGLIGGISAVVVLALLGWVIFKSRYFQKTGPAGGEKFTNEHLETKPDNSRTV